MSAYALPGSFKFLPTLSSQDANLVRDEDKHCGSIEPEVKKVTKSLDRMNTEDSNRDLSEARSKSSSVLISIKTATVDVGKLVHDLTTFQVKSPRRRRNNSFREKVVSLSTSLTGFSFGNNTIETLDDEQWGEYDDSLTSSTSEDSTQSTNDIQYNEQKVEQTTVQETFKQTNPSAHDDAITFTLSICLNGRKYMATRAFPTFVKLRNDLLLELRKHKGPNVRFSRYAIHRGTNNPDHFHEHKECEPGEGQVVIPELPIGDSNKVVGVMNMAGRGFRGLQDIVCTYCPPMEMWIQNVASLVPSSPTLANFLWEPIHGEESNATNSSTEPSVFYSNKHHSSCVGSMQTLNSIFESDDTDTEYDEDEMH